MGFRLLVPFTKQNRAPSKNRKLPYLGWTLWHDDLTADEPIAAAHQREEAGGSRFGDFMRALRSFERVEIWSKLIEMMSFSVLSLVEHRRIPLVSVGFHHLPVPSVAQKNIQVGDARTHVDRPL